MYVLYGYLGVMEICGNLNVNYKVLRIIEKAQQMAGIIFRWFSFIFFCNLQKLRALDVQDC